MRLAASPFLRRGQKINQRRLVTNKGLCRLAASLHTEMLKYY